MTYARDVISTDTAFLLASETITWAARKLRDCGADALWVVGADGELQGRLSEHDIVVTCLANGADPAHMLVCECAAEPGVVVDAAEHVSTVLRLLADHRAPRLPVVDERGCYLGVVTQEAVLAAVRAEHQHARATANRVSG